MTPGIYQLGAMVNNDGNLHNGLFCSCLENEEALCTGIEKELHAILQNEKKKNQIQDAKQSICIFLKNGYISITFKNGFIEI